MRWEGYSIFYHNVIVLDVVSVTKLVNAKGAVRPWLCPSIVIINSLAPGRCGYDFECVIFKLNLRIDILSSFCEIARRWMSRAHWWFGNIGPGNGLLPSGSKSPPEPGSAFIKPDQRNPWIKDQIKITLLPTISHLLLPNFVSCGRACPSHMTQNLVTVGAKLWTADRFIVDRWSMDYADPVW